MPLKIVRKTESKTEVSELRNIAFSKGEEGNFFSLSSSSGDNQISVAFTPPFISDWDPDKFEIFLFENPYLSAENDVFEIHVNTIADRIGYICPISTLDSTENNYIQHRFFKHYSWVAYWKLLNFDFEIDYAGTKFEYTLSEIFANLCVCILSKDDLSQIPDFKIEDYSLSLLKYDYLLWTSKINGTAIFDKTSIIQDLRNGSHKIAIKKSAFDIKSNDYIKALFLEHIYQSDSFLVKYIFLYQVFEHFIEELGDIQVDEVLQRYQQGKISKNSLKESLVRLSNDRNLLKKVLALTPFDSTLRKDFIGKCQQLSSEIGEDISSNFDDAIYDVRNLITHRYRSVSKNTSTVVEIVQFFEQIILDFLINYNTRTTEEEEGTEDQTQLVQIGENKTTKINSSGLNFWIRKFICHRILKCQKFNN